MRVDEARRLLARAAAEMGGVSKLAAELNVSERILRHYLDGHEPIPDNLYLMVVDVLLKD